MRPAPLIASGGLLLLACSCYGPAYQQPYGGYQGYPGQVQPGTPMYPGGTGVPGGPSLGQPTYDSSQVPLNNGGGNAPTYGNSSSTNGARPVPDYDEPASGNSPYFPSGGSTPPSDSATSVPEVAPLSFETSQPATPMPSTTPTPTPQPAPADSNPFFDLNSGGGDFQEPVQGNPISFQREVSAVTNQPYGQGQGHRWLQGVVNHDPRDGTWGIIYDIEPDAHDPHAGYLTIAQHSQVQGLQDGQIVRLEGQVDPVERDRFGRATYLVSRVSAAATVTGG